MSAPTEVAYCGLFCGACVIRRGRIAALSKELLERMGTPEFQKLAAGLPTLNAALFEALREWQACFRVLGAMRHLDCERTCRDGGGTTACRIRECCRRKNMQGCWECDQFEDCETLSWLDPVHGDAHRQNIRMICRQGMRAFLDGEKRW